MSATSRPLQPNGAGNFVLRPGRNYRLLCIVNGATSCEDLEAELARLGFTDPVSSSPDDWRAAADDGGKPDDWPPEPLLATAANEVLVRASGTFEPPDGLPTEFQNDIAIEGTEGRFTIGQAWDYGAPRRRAGHLAGAQAPAGGAEPTKRDDLGGKLVVGAIVAATGFCLYKAFQSSREDEKEVETLARLERAEEERSTERRLSRLLGHHEADDDTRLAALDRRLRELEAAGAQAVIYVPREAY
jgi:hypothetical protein